MNVFQQIGREGRATVILALPLVIGQVSQMLIGLADTYMIGQVGTVPLAAASFANTVIHLPFMFGIGMSIAVSVRVSQARGANEPAASRAAVRHGVFVTLGIGVLTVLFALGLLPFLSMFGQKEEVVAAMPTYFVIIAVSMIPGMASMALKNFADAMNRPWPAFWVMLGGVFLNIFLNWVFIYGKLGAPALGLEGAGVATVLARTATLIGLIVLCTKYPAFREWSPYRWFLRPDWPAVRNLVAIGLPTSLQILAEVSAFVAATVVIGWIGVDELAAHQVAIMCAATVFMVPLGISQALTVRIGEAWGAKTYERWRPIVMSGWALGVSFVFVSATLFLLFNDQMAASFLPEEPKTAAVAASLILVAAAFQMGDALQIISAGGLRGLNDVTIPMWLAILAYWVISLPLGYFLAFEREMSVNGMWWGITLGLCLTAGALGIRLWLKTGPRGIELLKERGEDRVAKGG